MWYWLQLAAAVLLIIGGTNLVGEHKLFIFTDQFQYESRDFVLETSGSL